MSRQIKQIINGRFNTTETTVTTGKKFNTTETTVNCKGKKCTPNEVDILIQDAVAAGVINPRMHGWYCKAAYTLGSKVFMRCVSQAKEGNHPPKLFSYLIDKELRG